MVESKAKELAIMPLLKIPLVIIVDLEVQVVMELKIG